MSHQDICKDKTAPYDIRRADADLIDAAKGLGRWLAVQPQATDQQREALAAMISFLDNLPAPSPGFNGDFDFEIQTEANAADGGDSGCWSVGVCRGFLEIFSTGRRRGTSNLTWTLCPGAVNANDISEISRWCAEVSDPCALLAPGDRLVINAFTWQVHEEPIAG